MDKIELLRKLVEESEDKATAWFLLGLEYKEDGQVAEAVKAFGEVLKCGPDDLKQKVIGELGKLSGLLKPVTGKLEQIEEPEVNSPEHVEDKIREKVVKLKLVKGGLNGTPSGQVISPITFADVGGLDDLKKAISMKIVKPFSHPDIFAKFKKKTGGGIILYGPPGCGKTFIASATAGECRARFIPVHITDILDPFLGVSEQNISNIFSSARAHPPTILFFDEIDGIGYHRAKSTSSLVRPMVDQLLAEMEGINTSTDRMLVIGATNMPWDIDPAFLRPGRFDKVVFVPPPDEKARITIFELKLKDRPVENIDLKELAKHTELYSGADIENVVEIAAELVISEIMSSGKERNIGMEDLLEAVSLTKPSTIDWLRTIKNYVKYANQGGLYDDVANFLALYKKALS